GGCAAAGILRVGQHGPSRDAIGQELRDAAPAHDSACLVEGHALSGREFSLARARAKYESPFSFWRKLREKRLTQINQRPMREESMTRKIVLLACSMLSGAALVCPPVAQAQQGDQAAVGA